MHRVAIGLDARLRRVCVLPRKSGSVVLEANVKNTSKYELLPGPVRVFMNDEYVTSTSLGVSIYLVVPDYANGS